MKTSFHRETSVLLKSMGPGENHRAHLFFLSLGFQGPLDTDSGMVVNLVAVDQILGRIKEQFQGVTLVYTESHLELPWLVAETLEMMKEVAEAEAVKLNLQLESLSLREVREGLHLEYQAATKALLLWTRHYLEQPDGVGQVFELKIGWNLLESEKRGALGRWDFHRKGLLLLKENYRKNWRPEDIGLLKDLERADSSILEMRLVDLQSNRMFLF